MAELQVTQARAAQGLARKQITGGVLVAPFDGLISSVACEEGEHFNPMTISPMGGPQALVGIVDLDTVKVDLQVADRDVAQLNVGMPAKILVDAFADQLPPEGLLGHVDSIGYAADPITRTFPVRVVAANP
ncbi:MAG: efflux RND transporter periplasmic adaptor subunit, partial [Deltaproteobacteria bacterium]|nr:efflux RND transporter periplasmic adaptor subunit [Deltaproteobacteria bacterium]